MIQINVKSPLNQHCSVTVKVLTILEEIKLHNFTKEVMLPRLFFIFFFLAAVIYFALHKVLKTFDFNQNTYFQTLTSVIAKKILQ